MANLSETEIADCKEVFGVYDMRNEGSVDAMQIADLLRSMNLKPLIKNVDKLTGATKPKQKKLTVEDFMPVYKEVTKNKDTGSYEDFIEAMKVYDKEQNGTIIQAELRHLLLSLGERLTDPQVEEIMRLCGNIDDDGNTKYEEFINKVLKGPFPDDDE